MKAALPSFVLKHCLDLVEHAPLLPRADLSNA